MGFTLEIYKKHKTNERRNAQWDSGAVARRSDVSIIPSSERTDMLSLGTVGHDGLGGEELRVMVHHLLGGVILCDAQRVDSQLARAGTDFRHRKSQLLSCKRGRLRARKVVGAERLGR